jgi:hypothetical protein
VAGDRDGEFSVNGHIAQGMNFGYDWADWNSH